MFSQPRVFECLEDLSKVMVEGQLTREKDRPHLEAALVSNLLEQVCVSKLIVSPLLPFASAPCPRLCVFWVVHAYMRLYLSACLRVCKRGAHVTAQTRDLTDISLSPRSTKASPST